MLSYSLYLAALYLAAPRWRVLQDAMQGAKCRTTQTGKFSTTPIPPRKDAI